MILFFLGVCVGVFITSILSISDKFRIVITPKNQERIST